MSKPQADAKVVKGPKQSTLMGFFGKPKPGPAPTPSSSTPRPGSSKVTSQSTPVASSRSLAKGSSSASIASQGSSSSANRKDQKKPAAEQTKTPVPTKAAKSAPSRPAQSVPTAASPNSTQLQTPSSTTGQSPTVVSSSQSVRRGSSPIKRPSSPLKNKARDDKESSSKAAKNIPTGQDSLEMDIDSDEEPIVTSRRTKRKVVYAESDSDGSVSEGEALRQATGKAKPTRKPRKSLKVDSDSDDYLFEDQDDIAMVNAVDDLEMRQASPSITSVSPPPASKKASGKKFVPPKAAKTKPSERGSSPVASSSRPGPKPLTGMSAGKAGESGKASSRGGPGDSDSWMLTNAERRKLDEKTSKREAQDTYHFLRPDQIRDSFMKRPDDPEYDERTIHIPKKAFESMTPFEKQFWEIKKDHFDTVLFFQKGKFYELYENDAAIGHQEFDLKLTDRVKMSMVGVPEQSFEFWAAKFLAAGYKVGKVEQAETAIGAQMRSKNEGAAGKKKGGDDGGTKEKIVRRELQQVFTNGTIVDGEYLTSDDANHCVAIKEFTDEATGTSSFGICTLDASTGEFNLTAFHDDVIRTRLETMFRQIRPKELIHAKGNLSVPTTRLLRHTLPSSTLWQSFREGREFYSADDTITHLAELFQTNDDPSSSAKPLLPPAIESMLETPLAMEALGGMLFYLKSLNLDKDLVSQKNFNIYDPIKEGKNLVLEGVTLNHMEVLVNNEGGTEGTLLELLQRCQTPFGKRLFRQWLTNPLRDANAINERLDAVDDLMNHTSFTSDFRKFAKELPDLERLISRIHAGQAKQTQFRQVMTAFEAIQEQFSRLLRFAEGFSSHAVAGLIRSAPDIAPHIAHVQGMYHREGDDKAILPNPGANEDCDKATLEVKRLEGEFDDLLIGYQRQLKSKEVKFWHSAQGGKEIYQLQVPAGIKVPSSWAKQSGTKAVSRYYNKDITVLVREFQEAKETENQTKRDFFKFLLAEFDKDQSLWLHTVRVIAELDCLVSLALASFNLDEPKCRPEFVDAPQAFVDFEELRHPSMCLRADFIANDVRLGDDGTGTDGGDEAGARARAVLLTGPNMAGKSTLLRMTAAGIIMAQMGCYVPARKARMSPVDRIQTRMGAYDNMFASASTFKVELDECSKILREAGPRSFVILDELGRGTSTYDGMAIAGAVLHHLATHTLPLAFFATHYGSLTDDYTYHPNIRNMHMKTFVDDARREVVFLYKLIPGVAESSHGTHVAKMAGVPDLVVSRADQVSAEFFMAFKSKLASRRQDALPIVAQADFAWLLKLATGSLDSGDAAGGGEISEMAVDGEDDPVFPGKGVSKLIREKASLGAQLDIIRRAIGAYEVV